MHMSLKLCSMYFSYPAHCHQCQFDLCDNCLKPYRSTYHGEEHLLYRADSTITYLQYNGGWRCDRCLRSFSPLEDKFPFHCSQCEFDLCPNCMRTTGMSSNEGRFSYYSWACVNILLCLAQGNNRVL